MKKEKYILILFILFLLPRVSNVITYCMDIYENTNGLNIAQKELEDYFKQKYPNNELFVISIDYVSKIKVYECNAKDESGIMFSARIDENCIVSDMYIESKVDYELQSKLIPFINKLMGKMDDPYIQIEAMPVNNEFEKPKVRLDLTLPNKDRVKTTQEFTNYAILVRDEILKLLENDYIIDEICIRLNSFVVDLGNNQLNYNSNDIEKITIIQSNI